MFLPCGKFDLWLFPEDTLKSLPDGRYQLVLPDKKDDIARSHGQRSRFELFWRLIFTLPVPEEFLLPAGEQDNRSRHDADQ